MLAKKYDFLPTQISACKAQVLQNFDRLSSGDNLEKRLGQYFVKNLWHSVKYEQIYLDVYGNCLHL